MTGLGLIVTYNIKTSLTDIMKQKYLETFIYELAEWWCFNFMVTEKKYANNSILLLWYMSPYSHSLLVTKMFNIRIPNGVHNSLFLAYIGWALYLPKKVTVRRTQLVPRSPLKLRWVQTYHIIGFLMQWWQINIECISLFCLLLWKP